MTNFLFSLLIAFFLHLVLFSFFDGAPVGPKDSVTPPALEITSVTLSVGDTDQTRQDQESEQIRTERERLSDPIEQVAPPQSTLSPAQPDVLPDLAPLPPVPPMENILEFPSRDAVVVPKYPSREKEPEWKEQWELKPEQLTTVRVVAEVVREQKTERSARSEPLPSPISPDEPLPAVQSPPIPKPKLQNVEVRSPQSRPKSFASEESSSAGAVRTSLVARKPIRTSYPMASRKANEEGRVELQIRVSAAGLPVAVQIRKSSGFKRLDDAAVRAVSRASFYPAKRGDQPIEAEFALAIEFRLSDSGWGK